MIVVCIVGRNIRKYRKLRDMTQIELADRSLIEQTIISRYETGKIIPPITKLESIAKALDVPLETLFKSEEETE